ncbi:hypothetical protein [Bacillus sp. C30]|uniref:hypothetical protein n=1 Tax=Bacillus sp. C30 TaxID=1387733 RepID=UPI00349F0ABA
MKKINKKVIPMLLVGGILAGNTAFVTNQVSADTLDNTTKKITSNIDSFKPSEEAIDFMSKVVNSGAINEFDFSSDLKTMSYKHDMDTIKNTYNFNDEDIAQLAHIVSFYNESMKNNPIAIGNFNNQSISSIKKGGPKNVVTDYGWTWIKMTFTNQETKLLLAGAAAEGAYALYAAFVGLTAITATPVGAAIVSALGLMGIPKFAGICQTILRALSAGKGVFIEIGMDGVLPYISASVARH